MSGWRARSARVAGAFGAVAVAAALAAGGGGLGIASGRGLPELAVVRGDLPITVAVAGALRSTDSSFLGPPQIPETWNFKISFLALEGTAAPAGLPVLRFDTSELERKLLDKVAERDQAQTELEKRRVELERTVREADLKLAEARARLRRAELKTDVPEELAAAKELFGARVDRRVAAAEVASLARRLELEKRAGQAELAGLAEKRRRAAERVAEMEGFLERMTVRAPRAGTVIYASDWRGDKVKVGDQVWQARKVLEIPDLAAMEADGRVDEADSGRLAVGQPVTLRLDAYPDRELRGRVRSIEKAVNRRERGLPVKEVALAIVLDETDTGAMRPAMRFQGEVEVERAAGVLLVPADAVRATAAGPVAWRRTLFGSAPVALTVGRRNDRFVEVLAGLAEGDRLVLPPEGEEER
jgi:multidrug resistance efflux pump